MMLLVVDDSERLVDLLGAGATDFPEITGMELGEGNSLPPRALAVESLELIIETPLLVGNPG